MATKLDTHLHNLVAQRLNASDEDEMARLNYEALSYLGDVYPDTTRNDLLVLWSGLLDTMTKRTPTDAAETFDADGVFNFAKALSYLSSICGIVNPLAVLRNKDYQFEVELTPEQYSKACQTLFAAEGHPDIRFEPYSVFYTWKPKARDYTVKLMQRRHKYPHVIQLSFKGN